MEEWEMIAKLMSYVKLLKMGAVVKEPVEGFIKLAKADPDGAGPAPANWKSTEFWIAQGVPQVALVWGGLQGVIPAKVWVVGTVSLAGVYIAARTGLKIVREVAPIVGAVKALKAGDYEGAAAEVANVTKEAA
jgi:hypothetical protein